MPIPAPEKGEKEADFMERCMGDTVMLKEYPDQKQRVAVCMASWTKERSVNENIERRALEGLEVAVRAEQGKELPVIRGYAAVFNTPSVDLGGFREQIVPGAFADSIKADDVRATVDHDPGKLIGRNRSGTLELREDAKGLAVEIRPPDTSAGRDVIESIRRGDLSGMSFSFRTIDDAWETVGGAQVRTLKKVQLRDVSPVAFPAYPDTSVACRSMEASKKQEQSGTSSSALRMRADLAERE